MVQIRKKSFVGLSVGVLLCVLMIWIEEKFKLSIKQSFLIVFIPLGVLGFLFSIFSNQIFDFLDKLFDNHSNYDRIEQLKIQLKKLNNSVDKKKIILKQSKKIKFGYLDVRSLIMDSKIEDDEFWISFFIENIKDFPKSEGDIMDFYGFLYYLDSENSISKLKKLLLSKGFPIENKNHESTAQIMRKLRLSRG